MVEKEPSSSAVPNRVLGLDSIRFFCALWVLMSHRARPPFTEGFDPSSPLAQKVNGLAWMLVSGPAAVIVFFIISGFCIHFPQRNLDQFNIGKFLARRYFRLVPPMLGAIVFSWVIKADLHDLSNTVLWSLFCELIYYSIYPLLFFAAKRIGWRNLFYISFVAALGVALTKPISTTVNYSAYGLMGNWIIGLPCWLLGVLLAQKFSQRPAMPGEISIWLWRSSAIGLGWVANTLALQQIIGHPFTLNFVAIFAFFWLQREIAWYTTHKPIKFFEWAGEWSYSIYLVHVLAFHMLNQAKIPMFGYVMNWLIKITFALLVSYIFYRIIEKPSHWLARRLVGRPQLVPHQKLQTVS
ncbi:MAG: acyltransferase [Verrucomicrobiota bacterium]|nr:acyltransferase [Verrucomicrobiota bacterium]